MSECDGNCSGCSQKGGCDSVLKKLEQNKNSNIKKVIGVVSVVHLLTTNKPQSHQVFDLSNLKRLHLLHE